MRQLIHCDALSLKKMVLARMPRWVNRLDAAVQQVALYMYVLLTMFSWKAYIGEDRDQVY